MHRKKSILKLIFFNFVILLALLCFIEGLASFLFVFHKIAKAPSSAEVYHAEFDPDLGWINKPNFFSENLYGEGKFFQTNSQRFRNKEEFTLAVAPEKIRLICTGDSFTLGFGVSNSNAWCNKLSTFDSRIEAVNMGQGGYGVDQAFLWYQRDAAKLDHDIHLFGFILEDLKRMNADTLGSYTKPTVGLRGEKIVIETRPKAPWLSTLSSIFNQKIRENLDLSLVDIVRVFKKRMAGDSNSNVVLNDMSMDISSQIFRELKVMNEKKGSRLVVVLLPTDGEIMNDEKSRDLRENIAATLKKENIPFWDLTEDLRKAFTGHLDEYFIKGMNDILPYADGHYNEKGNEVVATNLYERLKLSGLIDFSIQVNAIEA